MARGGRRRLFQRKNSDGFHSSAGDSFEDDSTGALGSSRHGMGSDDGVGGGYGSEGGIVSDPTGNRRSSRFGRSLRKRFSRSVDEADLLNVPRRTGGRRRAASQDSSLGGYDGDRGESRLKKLRQRLNPFSGRRGGGSGSNDDLDSLGLGSADEGNRRRRGGPRPGAIRNWRKKGGDSETRGDGPPIRNVSFDTNDSSTQPTVRSSESPMSMPPLVKQDSNSMINFVTHQPRSEGRRARYSVYHGKSTTKKKFRVRPYHVFDEPRHMTEEQIYADSTQPSVYYEFLKSYIRPTMKPSKKLDAPEEVKDLFGTPAYDGRIGSIRVEVLGCVSLDRQKPDVCAYMVCGDSAFCTDVIQGYRSPMWPCESRRAAVFALHHAYSQVFVGVFDVRARKNKENDVFCGRVCIDIAPLRPDTEYDITFPLRASTFVYDRRKRGVIRLRFSLHWFSERAAVLSYFKGPKSMLRNQPLLAGYPTIPCADPKTFRNVAYTVYGADLPGKYSRTAFRSTVREFTLYHTNFRFILKMLVYDAILYEKPYISLYLFCGGLYLVWMESTRLVPPFCLLYVLIQYWENYVHFVLKSSYNEGYQQITMLEVLRGLLFDAMNNNRPGNFKAIRVVKKAKKQGVRGRRAGVRNLKRLESLDPDESVADDDQDIALEDHKEFPFSHAEGYPKFGVEDSLAPSKSGGGTQRLHGRLSVYYVNPTEEDEDGEQNNTGDDDSDSDDETVITTTGMGDTMLDIENLEDEDDEEELQYQHGARRSKSRVHLGTPQSNDVEGRKVPPQVTLKKMEYLFHKWSWKVAYELVAAPPLHGDVAVQSAYAREKEQREYRDLDESEKKAAAALKRKYPMDEFDRLLALEFKSANPVNRILASFLGPMMRMGRTVIYVIRIAFNATTWRDPFLSFWIFVTLFSIWIVLLIFPWKLFFFVSTLLLVGPQNILLRYALIKRAEKRERERREAAMTGDWDNASNQGGVGSNVSTSSGDSGRKAGTLAGMSLLSRRSTRKGQKRPSIDNMEGMSGERAPFSSDLYGKSSSSKLSPRSIAVPYSRMRKDRFYDWPPDPTVSRATPLPLFGSTPGEAEMQRDDDSSLEEFDDMDAGPAPDYQTQPAADSFLYQCPSSPRSKPVPPESPYEPVSDTQDPPDTEPEQPMEYDMPASDFGYDDNGLRRRHVAPPEPQFGQEPEYNNEYIAEYEAMGYGD